jgi:hypothetical protein
MSVVAVVLESSFDFHWVCVRHMAYALMFCMP